MRVKPSTINTKGAKEDAFRHLLQVSEEQVNDNRVKLLDERNVRIREKNEKRKLHRKERQKKLKLKPEHTLDGVVDKTEIKKYFMDERRIDLPRTDNYLPYVIKKDSIGETVYDLMGYRIEDGCPIDLRDEMMSVFDVMKDKYGRFPQVSAMRVFAYILGSYRGRYEGCQSRKIMQNLQSKIDTKYYPLKSHPAAATKVNVFFRDAYIDACRAFPKSAYAYTQYHKRMMELNVCNDYATAILIWFITLYERSPGTALFGIDTLLDGDADALSNWIKTLGTAAFPYGYYLVEMKTMKGRASKEPDVWSDIQKRIDPIICERDCLCHINTEDLKPYIRRVIDEEFKSRPVYGTTEDHWTRRWAYTKSGAHQPRIHSIKGIHIDDDMVDRPTRRDFAEAVKENMICFGEPSCHTSPAMKLEHGKTRIIYSTDTVNYYSFDYLMQPVEKVWRNKRAIINPGEVCDSKFYQNASRYRYKMMLDYVDFNSQHRLDAMQYVIEYACRDAPKEVVDWAVQSLANGWIWYQNEKYKCVGTMFSGHRCTTFFNTVLSAAYIMYLCKDDYDHMKSYHVGDDVLLLMNEIEVYKRVYEATNSPKIRTSKEKQSSGCVCGEFLRITFNTQGALGYASRCISALVSGNWTVEHPLGSADYLDSIMNHLWTLSNRTNYIYAGQLLITTICRRCRMDYTMARSICMLKSSINNSPVKLCGGTMFNAYYTIDRFNNEEVKGYNKHHATDDFLTHHVDEKLLKLLDVERGELCNLMVDATRSAHVRYARNIVDVRCTKKYIENAYVKYYGEDFIEGALNNIFPISLIKSRLNTDQILILLNAFGVKKGQSAWETAFGLPTTIVSAGQTRTLGYGEMRRLARRATFSGVVRIDYPMYV